jgi:hypothetical protein
MGASAKMEAEVKKRRGIKRRKGKGSDKTRQPHALH